jgi:hypothetical protein
MTEFKTFLDLFTYNHIGKGALCSVYRDCSILKDFDTFKQGQTYETITIHITLHGWNGEYDDEEAGDFI